MSNYATDLLPITFSVILPSNPHGKNSRNYQIKPGILDENKNLKAHTIKILLDSGDNASINFLQTTSINEAQ